MDSYRPSASEPAAKHAVAGSESSELAGTSGSTIVVTFTAGRTVRYELIGRAESASPATGSHKAQVIEQQEILGKALGRAQAAGLGATRAKATCYTQVMAAKRCPICNLVNPKSALGCDCGWSFAQQTLTDRPLVVAGRGAATTSHPWRLVLGLMFPGVFIWLMIVRFFRWLYRRHVRLRQERRAKELGAFPRAVVLPPERRG